MGIRCNPGFWRLDSGGHDSEKEYMHMEKYRILMEMNRKAIFSEEISDLEKEKAVSGLLNGICCKEEIHNYKKHMKVSIDTDNIYPDYFIPPYNGKK